MTSKIEDYARAHSRQPANYYICAMLNQYGQRGTADRIGISQPALSQWLDRHGVILMPLWGIKASEEDLADIDAAVERARAKGNLDDPGDQELPTD